MIVDEKISDDTTIHTLLRNMGTNKVTGTSAVALAVLSINENAEEITYANIARALAADYFSLYYVNLETEDFIEYTSPAGKESMAVERHGTNFFEKARADAASHIFEEDVEKFVSAFTKEHVVEAIDTQQSFTIDYRLMMEGRPVYVHMKAMRMAPKSDHIIIGVSNINLQMNQRKAIEALMQEQRVFNRIKSLTGDFIVMYNIDPETGSYTESTVTDEYAGLGLSKKGDDFFKDAYANAEKYVAPEDRDRFRRDIATKSLIDKIDKEGLFVMKYNMIIGDEPNLVKLRANLVDEPDGKKLIIAVNHIFD